MKNLNLLTVTLLLTSAVSFAGGHKPNTELGAYQVTFDGNPVFNLYALCVNGDSIQSTFAYSNCKEWGTESCAVSYRPSFHPEKIERYEMVCRPGTEGWEGGCASYDQVRVKTRFPLQYQVTIVNADNFGSDEPEVLGYTTYTIPNCK